MITATIYECGFNITQNIAHNSLKSELDNVVSIQSYDRSILLINNGCPLFKILPNSIEVDTFSLVRFYMIIETDQHEDNRKKDFWDEMFEIRITRTTDKQKSSKKIGIFIFLFF